MIRSEPYRNISFALGKLNEIWVLSHLQGNIPEVKQEQYKMLKSVLSEEQRIAAGIKAFFTVQYIRAKLIANNDHIIIDTSNGVEGESQRENPSDVVISYHSGVQVGLSLKATKWKGTLSNPGLGTIESYTGIDSKPFYDVGIEQLVCEFPELEGVARKKIKDHLKKNYWMKARSEGIGNIVLTQIAQEQLIALHELQGKKKEKFLKEMFKALPTSFPVYQVETKLVDNCHKTTHIDLSKAFVYHADEIAIKYNDGMGGDFYHGDNKIATLRFKFENMFGSAIKGAFRIE